MTDMLRRIQRATAYQVQTLGRTRRSDTGSQSAAELCTLTAQSHDDFDINSSHADSSSNSKDQTSASHKKLSAMRRYKSRVTGWKTGVVNFAVCACIVLTINMVVSIWGSAAYKRKVLTEGNCEQTKRLNSGLHVLINILSTILLSGSNYCMQCLSAPTREEVDSAHSARKWLDIGIPSIRNLRRISRPRLVVWVLLGLSTAPLHLLYVDSVSIPVINR
jgi:hypothetical protein